MLRILYVCTDVNLSLVGDQRFSNLPLGLQTMLQASLAIMHDIIPTAHTILFDSDPNLNLRAANGILELSECNKPIKILGSQKVIDSWTSFLLWHTWWMAPRWTNRITQDGDHFAQCTDCGQTTHGDEFPEKCSNMACLSQANWDKVNGIMPS